MAFRNSYEDAVRAEAYARLEFAGTYYLAYRDLPDIIARHVKGCRAVDFGCGTGRSSRFLKGLGFDTIGIDISSEMVSIARKIDPDGDYRVISDGDLSQLAPGSHDLVLSAFTFDNIPGEGRRAGLFKGLAGLLNGDGILINLVSTPDMYTHEWASFSVADYPENKNAKSGDEVLIITTDFEDSRPCRDIFWLDEDYRKLFEAAGLDLVEVYKPLATGDEPYEWVNETRIAPWIIYVLRKKEAQ